MNTHLLVGKVAHRRSRPVEYALQNDVWYVALDLDELNRLPAVSRLIRRNRRGVLEFRDSDYLPESSRDIRAGIRGVLGDANINVDIARITLVTNLRVMGYQFNPASFYLCRDSAGALRAVVVEVHNTYGERHLYPLVNEVADAPADSLSAEMDKAFYVSPFIGSEGRYRVTVRDGERGLAIGINEREGGRPLLSTSLRLSRMPLTDRNLVRLLLRFPLVTHKTIVAIHWHALRLWLRGVTWHKHAPANRVAHAQPQVET